MISFALDVVKEIATAVLKARVTDKRGEAIRTFISLRDGIERVERSSESLLDAFQAYVDSAGEAIDAGKLRRHVYDFASAVVEFARAYDRVDRVLQVFAPELASSFRTIGRIKLPVSRSLLEVTAPTVCVDRTLPWQQRHYHLRVLDYSSVDFAASELRKQWESRAREFEARATGMGGMTRAEEEKELPTPQWVATSPPRKNKFRLEDRLVKQMSFDDYEKLRSSVAEVSECRLEDRLVNLLSVKHLSFDDYEELRSLVAEAQPRLAELKSARTRLEEFLAKNFTVTDFF